MRQNSLVPHSPLEPLLSPEGWAHASAEPVDADRPRPLPRPVRPGLADPGPAGAAPTSRGRGGHPPGARRATGRGRGPGDRGAARPDPARGPTGRPRLARAARLAGPGRSPALLRHLGRHVVVPGRAGRDPGRRPGRRARTPHDGQRASGWRGRWTTAAGWCGAVRGPSPAGWRSRAGATPSTRPPTSTAAGSCGRTARRRRRRSPMPTRRRSRSPRWTRSSGSTRTPRTGGRRWRARLRARIEAAFLPDVMALEADDTPVPGAGSQLGWLLWADALSGPTRAGSLPIG